MAKTGSPKKAAPSLKVLAPVLAILVVVVVAIGARLAFLPGGQGDAAIGGPFELVNGQGETVTEQDFAGKYMLVYFGYTYCPDVCPTSLSLTGAALDMLTVEQRDQIAPIFITVDPDRDTPDVVGAYAKAFYPSMVGLTGTTAQVAAAARAYKVYFKKVEEEGDAPYLMDHSAITYLMGPDGKFLTHFSHGTPPEKIAEILGKYLSGSVKGS
ncbi:MAG: SCO family protein [Rhodospirillum sp.]|nr:SCO family protein [Rhodospirillum sp.]MCF8491661.1 SCO family protein [Rhodospirillum sp.]MCF8501367.1 SCO family protein [Rhodospirillum sp.]